MEELRRELSQLTNNIPPEAAFGNARDTWLEQQINNIDKLRSKYSHSIVLHQRKSRSTSEQNCFCYALEISADLIRDKCFGSTFPGKNFMEYLLKSRKLLRKSEDRLGDNDIVVYFDNDTPLHAGLWRSGRVISKWGSGQTHVWNHSLFEVPSDYGVEVKFFSPIPDAVEIYREWATNRGM